MQEAVGFGGVEVKDTVKSGCGKPILDQRDESPSDRGFGEISLSEDAHDVFDPRSGGFAEDVLPLKALEVELNRFAQVPVRKEGLGVGQQCPGLDDSACVTFVRFAGLELNSLGIPKIHGCPPARSRIGSERAVPRLPSQSDSPIDRSWSESTYPIREQ